MSWHHLASTRFRRCWCYPYSLQSMKSTTSVAKKLSLCHFFQIRFGMSPSIDLFLKEKYGKLGQLLSSQSCTMPKTKSWKSFTVTLAALFQRSLFNRPPNFQWKRHDDAARPLHPAMFGTSGSTLGVNGLVMCDMQKTQHLLMRCHFCWLPIPDIIYIYIDVWCSMYHTLGSVY